MSWNDISSNIPKNYWYYSYNLAGIWVSKEVKQLKKELAEAQRRIEETYQELGKTKMENEILKKKANL